MDQWAGVKGSVYSMLAWDPDGTGPQQSRLIVGGELSAAGSVRATRIAQWDPAARVWSALDAGLSNAHIVWDLAIADDGTLLALSRRYDPASGQYSARVDRWHAPSAAWAPVIPETFQLGSDMIVLADGDLVFAGQLNYVPSVRRWDAASGTFSTLGIATGGNVSSVALLPSGDIVAGGVFTHMNGVPASRLALWNHALGTWTQLAQGLVGSVEDLLALADGSVVIGGSFNPVGDTARRDVVRWDPATNSFVSMGAGVSGGVSQSKVLSLAQAADGSIYTAGDFASIDGVPALNLARWDWSSGTWSAVGSGSERGYAIAALPDGRVAASGFSAAEGLPAEGIAVWDPAARRWSPTVPGTQGNVYRIRASIDGDLIVAGESTGRGGIASPGIIRFDTSANQWQAIGGGPDQNAGMFVFDFAETPDGDIIAVGRFSSARGTPANNVARWDRQTDSWSAYGPGVNQLVTAVLPLPNGDLIIGGLFTASGPAPLAGIARWSHTLQRWEPLGTGLSAGGMPVSVNNLSLLADGSLLVQGNFAFAGGIRSFGLARWSFQSNQWAAALWPTGTTITGPVIGPVQNGSLLAITGAGGVGPGAITRYRVHRALPAPDTWSLVAEELEFGPTVSSADATLLTRNDLLVVGRFTRAGSMNSSGVASWNTLSERWSTIPAPFDVPPSRVAMLGESVAAVGGDFSSIGAEAAPGLARYSFAGPATVSIQPSPTTVDAGLTVVLAATPSSARSNVSARWYKDGVAVNDGPGGASTQGGTVFGSSFISPSPSDGTPAVLIIDSARRSDAGVYTVVFSNPCGSITSNAATVTIRPGCPADIDGSGITDLADFFEFLNCYDAGDSCADIDGTPGTDLADLFLFFASFDVGC